MPGYVPGPAGATSRRVGALLASGLLASLWACAPITERDATTGATPPADRAPRTTTGSETATTGLPTPFEPSNDANRFAIGAPIPEFALRAQNGDEVPLSAWRGKVVIVTFFETRSPEPTLCPQLIDRLSALREMLLPERTPDVHLVAAGVDPDHDTSDALAAWVSDRGIGSDGWTVGTMDSETLARIAAGFGVVVWRRADGSVGHTLNTVVIDRRGRFVDQFPGVSGWSTADLLAAVTAAADR